MHLKSESYIIRTETGGFEQCSQFIVDWNLVLNGTKPQNQEVGDLKIYDNQILEELFNKWLGSWCVYRWLGIWHWKLPQVWREKPTRPHLPSEQVSSKRSRLGLWWLLDPSILTGRLKKEHHIYLLSSVHLLCWGRSWDALLWLAQVREGLENPIIELSWTATTTAEYLPSFLPTWSLWYLALRSPSSRNTSHSASCGN